MTCELCGGDGWVRVNTADGNGAMARCVCRKVHKLQSPPGTTLTEETALALVAGLCEVLEFAPKSPMARTIISSGLMSMCSTQEQAAWVVEQACMHYTKWSDCGLRGLRQILCSQHRPKDGIESSPTAAYPDGIPSKRPDEPKPGMLSGGSVPLLPASEASLDPELNRVIKQITGARSMDSLPDLSPAERKRAKEFDKVLQEIETAPAEREPAPIQRKAPKQSDIVRLAHDVEHEPLPEGSYPRITQADIDEAVRQLREKKGTG